MGDARVALHGKRTFLPLFLSLLRGGQRRKSGRVPDERDPEGSPLCVHCPLSMAGTGHVKYQALAPYSHAALKHHLLTLLDLNSKSRADEIEFKRQKNMAFKCRRSR